jgi:arylsulfatase A-like enzyme
MDIIQVTVDSVRADHCGWLTDGDGQPDLTPTLDGLAADSVTFSTAIAPGPRTPSSVPVSHTGVHFPPNEHGTVTYEQRAARIRSHVERCETVSQSLRDAGYTTMAFTANPWTTTNTSFDLGFDEFSEVGRTGGGIWSHFQGTLLDRPARLFDRWIHDDTWFCRWRSFYDEVVSTIEAADGPVYAWIFLLDPHNPYLVPRSDRHECSTAGMYSAVVRANQILTDADGGTAIEDSVDEKTVERLRHAYRDCIRSVDTFIDRLLSDIGDDAMFVFHSDHGEAFGEHGQFGHSPSLFEENVHVPALVHGVGRSETVEEPFSTANLANVIRSYARDEDAHPTRWTSDHAVARVEDDSAIALRGTRWKYIRRDSDEVLYDLCEDPNERRDVSEDRSMVCEAFRRKCDAHLDSLPESQSAAGAADDGEVKQHLESLGYL